MYIHIHTHIFPFIVFRNCAVGDTLSVNRYVTFLLFEFFFTILCNKILVTSQSFDNLPELKQQKDITRGSLG